MVLAVKNLPANAGDIRDMRDTGSIPGSGRFPGEHGIGITTILDM